MKKCMLAVIAALFISFGGTAKAMTVFDPSNYAENLRAAIEAVEQTQRLRDQLMTQINQYERMLKDAMSLDTFVMGDLRYYLRELENFQNDVLGTIGRLLSSGGGGGSGGGGAAIAEVIREFYGPEHLSNNVSLLVSQEGREKLFRADFLGGELTKAYADASLKVAENQTTSMVDFQDRYEQVLDATRSAGGEVQAIQAQTELLSLILEMLGNIHHLMLANVSMDAARHETVVAREARQQAAAAVLTGRSELLESQTRSAKSYSIFE